MEVIVKEKTQKSILLMFKGVDIGFLHLLANELLNDERILNAYAKKPHLLSDEINFFVLTKSSFNVINLIDEKIKKIQKNFKELKKKFEMEIKSKNEKNTKT